MSWLQRIGWRPGIPREDHFQDITVSGNISLGATTTILPEFTPARIAEIRIAGESGIETIQDAINDANSGGGGYVFIPAGTYTITDSGNNVGLRLKDNVYLVGAGQGRTILKLGDGENSHVILASGISNTGVFNLTVDGNRTNGTGSAVHGIRSGGVTNFHIDNVEVKECLGYGIGLEAGDQIGIYLRNLYINNVGRDGIDFKNPNGLNDAIFLSNIRVEDFGLDGSLAGQKGVDIRGPAVISGLFVNGFSSDGRGVAFNLTVGGAVGGRRSSLSNFHFETATTGTTIGVETGNDWVAVSNGYIRNLATGWKVVGNAQGNSITNVTCDSCTTGFHVSDGDLAALSNVIASGGTTGFQFTTAIRNTLVNGRATSTTGILIDAAGADNVIIGGNYTGSTTPLTDNGTNTQVIAADDITPNVIRRNLKLLADLELDGDLNHDGSNVGFYGTSPTAQQTGVVVSSAGIHAALVNLGLITA